MDQAVTPRPAAVISDCDQRYNVDNFHGTVHVDIALHEDVLVPRPSAVTPLGVIAAVQRSSMTVITCCH
ncbi:unnamed protein product [Phytophthora lilii]|uniref:Unnamed protein product n=1 Tax=Phytophthora lilii TaxID=2077276 RepID=A0A9W6U5A0_9STRA|nr:unnamed protein product [Phytophthora lilii]